MYCPNPDCPDLDEPGGQGEYLPEVSQCPTCGAALVPEVPGGADGSAAIEEDLVSAFKVTNAALLPVAKSLLNAAGIRFAVSNEQVQGLIGWGQLGTGFNPLTGPPEILVREHDLDRASILLEELGQSDEDEA